MKVAFVSQAYDRLFPPSQNSIGLIAYYTALEIARHTDVAVYGRHYRDDVLPAALPFSVTRLPVSRDRVLQKFIRRFPGLARRFGIEGKLDDHRQYRREVGRRISTRPSGHRPRDELLALVPRAQGAGLVPSARARNAVRVAVAA